VTGLDRLIVSMAQGFTERPASASPEVQLEVTEVCFDVPIESQLDLRDLVAVTLPLGLLATGFERPLGRLRLRLEGTGS
jgi:hypothetical protein